jgi:hypothetical protein
MQASLRRFVLVVVLDLLGSCVQKRSRFFRNYGLLGRTKGEHGRAALKSELAVTVPIPS